VSRMVLFLGLLLVGLNLIIGTQGKALLQALGIKTPKAGGGPGVGGGGGGGGGLDTTLAASLPPVSQAPAPSPISSPTSDFRASPTVDNFGGGSDR